MTIPDECTGTKASIRWASGTGLNGRMCEYLESLYVLFDDFFSVPSRDYVISIVVGFVFSFVLRTNVRVVR